MMELSFVLIVVGLVLRYVTKDRRWLRMTYVGLVWPVLACGLATYYFVS